MKKKVLVTGGTGFIGSNLCEELLKRGYLVTCLDNLSVGTLKNCQSFSKDKNFKFIKGDVRTRSLVENIVKDVDVIYHLAAVVGVSAVVANRLENISVNIDGTRVIGEAALKLGKKKVVFTSSSEVYGKNDKVPLSEADSLSVFGPTTVSRWAYGMAKAIDEHYLLALSEKGLPISIVRYFNSYGPRGINNSYANVIPKFILQALKNEPITVYGNGNDTRCFCYVSETVNGTILAEENQENEIINIGANQEIAISNLARLIKKITNSKSAIIHGDENIIFGKYYESSKRRMPDISKAKRLLKFKPVIGLDKGLKKTVEWIKTSSY